MAFPETMTMMDKVKSGARFVYNDHSYQCQGSWSVTELSGLHSEVEELKLPKENGILINGHSLSAFDSAGALALQHIIEQLEEKGKKISLSGFSEQHNDLLKLVKDKKVSMHHEVFSPSKKSFLDRLGRETVYKVEQATGFINLLGNVCVKMVGIFGKSHYFRLPGIISNVSSTGIQALPILALLSFLIGVVLAYQMGLQLQTYGANTFIAYLSGMAIFREFASLITAIIVAGRTSSAFTAQIGSMKINEEIDAIRTMGLSATELLVLPKVIGLLLVFPLLIFWSDIFSIIGAMIMSKWMLDIGYMDFLTKLKLNVGLSQLMLGLYKAPAFAIIIALVGCFQGFAVKFNADSIGTQTTRSVVQALFLIIIADALFSVVYSWLDL